MATPFRFAILLDLAREQADDAAQALGHATRLLARAQQMLEQLTHYQAEYNTQLLKNAGRGMAAHQWQDFQRFLLRLDESAQQQSGEITRLEQVRASALSTWQQALQRVKAYEILEQQHRAQEARAEARREQKQTDDWVNGMHARRPVNRVQE